MVKIYRNRVYSSISSIGSLLYLLGFFFQSCSIRGRELNINPIPIESLQNDLRFYVNGFFPRELRSKFTRLEGEGFVGG
ncbi:MAG: hypothetical protein NMK33_00025 [Candidatus Cardinium sp.]|nr:MAG: hypothetical protein NMK33_00025 [Candidatus Cardinium sp.]